MIVADTSALIAILMDEHDADAFAIALRDSDNVAIGAATQFELMLIMIGRVGIEGQGRAADLLAYARITSIPFDEAQQRIATRAFARYGKGQGHPAQLNFGDCMAYAVAKALDTPLLYKGEDFAQTDIRSALEA